MSRIKRQLHANVHVQNILYTILIFMGGATHENFLTTKISQSTVSLTRYGIGNIGDISKVGCVWDSKATHSMSMTPLLGREEYTSGIPHTCNQIV